MKIGSYIATFAFCAFATANAQTTAVTCMPSSSVPLVRAEGLAELLGDITLDCTGTPGPSGGSLTITLPVNITSRLLADGQPDITLTAETGSGATPVGTATIGTNSVTFVNADITLPPSGKATLRVSNLRAAVSQAGVTNTTPIQAVLSSVGFYFPQNTVDVALPQRGLLEGFGHGTINCAGSPLPSQASFSNFLSAGTRFGSFRVTGGFRTVFQKKSGSADTGTRIVARYTGFPPGARAFVPDAIAGSSALQPTAAGDLGLTASGGRYAPSATGSLLLVRVLNPDANGAGGTLVLDVTTLGPAPTTFDSVGELALTNGSGTAVYEVVDSSTLKESAQIPVFIGLAPTAVVAANIDVKITFGPLSTDATASATAPIPRFVDTEPLPDCGNPGDCVSSAP